MGDASIHLPEPEPTGPVKDQIYRYRGEAVSVGGAMDWTIGRLAIRFAGSQQRTTSRRWADLKRYLQEHELTDGLQRELNDVANYFAARERAAHSRTIVVQIGDTTQILRLYDDRDTPNIEEVTTETLKHDAATTRKGHKAAQAVARAMDDDNPEVLADLNSVAKWLLIGRA